MCVHQHVHRHGSGLSRELSDGVLPESPMHRISPNSA